MTRMDPKKRCMIPKNVKETLKLREKSLLKGRVKDENNLRMDFYC